MALEVPIPILLWRLYTQVGNGGWGPGNGVVGVPTHGAAPDRTDIVGLYRMFTSTKHASGSAVVEWPRGLVPFIVLDGVSLDGVSMEVCDFLRRPYPVFKADGGTLDAERPLTEALIPVAPSLAERLEAWLADSTDDPSLTRAGPD